MLYRYKPEEGRNVRQAGFWLGEAMVAFGCFALRGQLNRFVGLREPLVEGMPKVPILGADLNGSFLIALVAFLLGSFFWVRFLARERVADHLIEVEGEVKKVTWPSFKEASNSSIIVIGTVLVLMAFLAFSDLILGRLFQAVLWGSI